MMHESKTMKWDLKATLARHDKTLGGLAEHLGVDRTTLTRWVRGRTYPPLDKIPAIAAYIGCPVREFLDFEETESDFKSGRQGRRVA